MNYRVSFILVLFSIAFSFPSSAQSSFRHGPGLQVGMLNHYHPILAEGKALHVSTYMSLQLSYQLKYQLNPSFAVSSYPAAGVVSYVASPFEDLIGGHYHFPLGIEFSPEIGGKRTAMVGVGLSTFGFAGGSWKSRTFVAPQVSAGLNFPSDNPRFSVRLAAGLSNIASEEQLGSDLAYRDRYFNSTLALYYTFPGK